MRLFHTIAGLRCYLSHQRQDKTIGLVPTMGALHAGHLSLIQRATAENEVVVVSIFVNPLQFGPTEDFDRYPRSLETDCRLCEQMGVDAVFVPSALEMGMNPMSESPKTTLVIPPQLMMSGLCGKSRPGHFEGVATVVTKLLNVVQPDSAYFGQKDAQQLAIIRRLVADLRIPVKIRPCAIAREASGLALSSRNQYLSPQEKEQASVLFRSLQKAHEAFAVGESDSSMLKEIVRQELASVPDVNVEYVELVDPDRLTPIDAVKEEGLLAIAAKVGSTRLIDNIILHRRQPIVAIDGPAGAGKSTVTRRVAEALGLLYLDTGAMYRALTWLVMQSDIAFEDEAAIAELASQADIQLVPANSADAVVRVYINGEDVTERIRTQAVTNNVSAIAAQPAVREELVKQQQRWGKKGGIVAEGRDIGTHVFPDAELKIFLTASVQERARRRLQDLQEQGEGDVSLQQLEKDIETRDYKDSHREVAPLQKAADAIEVNTDGLSIEEVTDKIISLYSQHRNKL